MKAKGFAVAIVSAFSFFFSAFAAPAGAPVISVDGTVATTSPVTRGDQATISMTTSFAGGAIFYTLDGSAPSGASTRYTAPFNLTTTRTIRALAYSIDFAQSAEADPLEVRIVPTYTITVAGTGGDVNLSPAGPRYMAGTVVRLTATGRAGWSFMRWEGDLSGSENPVNITVDGNKAVTGVFGSPLNIAAAANGTIVTTPAVTAGTLYPANTTFRIAALPNAGFYFVTWGGALSGARSPFLYVHSTPNATVSALFSPTPAGKATLSATASAGGVAEVFDYRQNGGATNLYDLGTTMLVIARPDAGYAFTHWSGDASGSDNPIAVTLDASKAVQANFAVGASLTVHSTDGGSVTRSVPGPVYAAGTPVELTATPEAGHTFVGWSGAVNSTANPVTVTVNSNIEVTAQFAAPAWEPLWSYARGAGNLVAKGDIVYGAALVSLTADGQLRWAQDLSDAGGYPAFVWLKGIDPNGRVRLGRTIEQDFDRHTAAIWTRDEAGASPLAPISLGGTQFEDLSISMEGDLYSVVRLQGRLGTVGDRMIAHTGAGAEKWQFEVEGWRGGFFGDVVYEELTRPAIGTDHNLYFGGYFTTTNSIYALTPAKTQLWRLFLDHGNLQNVGQAGLTDYKGTDYHIPSEVVLGQNAGYVVQGDGSLVAFDFQGNKQWTFLARDIIGVPSVGADGTLYAGARNSGRFYAINPNGTVRWVKQPALGGYSEPAIGADGTIYLAADRRLIAMNTAGEKIKEFVASNTLRAPIIEGDRLYTGTSSVIYGFAALGGPAASSWPMVDANAQRTAAANVVMAPPQIAEAFMSEEGFNLRIEARPGAMVKIYRSSDGEEWILHHSETTVNGSVFFRYSPATGTQLFAVSQE